MIAAVAFGLAYLMLVRVLSRPALLARTDAAKDVEIRSWPPLRRRPQNPELRPSDRFPSATHGFLSLPSVMPQASPAGGDPPVPPVPPG
jgi:hypothetical protein